MSVKIIPKPIISHELMEAELVGRGYKISKLQLDASFTCYSAPGGRSWFSRDATLSYPFVTGSARLICKDKQLSQLFAHSQGAAVAETLVFPQPKSVIKQFLAAHAPLVVKPLDNAGSRGLTLNITDDTGVDKALANAKEFSDRVLMQRQFSGQEVRITISRGKVLAVILRQTPRVVGDGIATVAELIAKENIERTKLSFRYMAYPQLSAELIPEHWLTDSRVAGRGEIVELSKSTLVSGGASLYNITETMHGSYKAMAVKLADILNPDFLIVDMLIADYSQALTAHNYIFLEFTTSPALKMYYGMRDGKQYDLVRRLADMIDEYCGVQTTGRMSE